MKNSYSSPNSSASASSAATNSDSDILRQFSRKTTKNLKKKIKLKFEIHSRSEIMKTVSGIQIFQTFELRSGIGSSFPHRWFLISAIAGTATAPLSPPRHNFPNVSPAEGKVEPNHRRRLQPVHSRCESDLSNFPFPVHFSVRCFTENYLRATDSIVA